MNSMTGIAIALIAGFMLAAAVACESVPASPGAVEPVTTVEPTEVPTVIQPSEPTTGGQPVAESTPTPPGEPVMVEVLAPIHEAHVRVAESFPTQYFLEVTSGLPNGCIKFNGHEVTSEDYTIEVTVTNLEPKSGGLIACDMRYGIVTTDIPLGSDFEPGKTYTVHVNDVTSQFTAQGSSDAPTGPGTAGPTALGESFLLGEGQTATIESEGLSVSFVNVSEDSRCPSGVTCIWAGQAKVVIGVVHTATGEDLGVREIVLGGGGGEAATASFGRYSVEVLTLDPYPDAPEQGDRPDYTVTLMVSASDPGSRLDDSQGTTDAVTVHLRGEPVAGQPFTILFTAELVGEPDNNKELYCQRADWNFGDGMGATVTASCVVWPPEAKINRRHEQAHTYEGPGPRQVTFTYGPLPTEIIEVDVR
jgi:hypothetical protein